MATLLQITTPITILLCIIIINPVRLQEIIQSEKIRCDAPLKGAMFDIDMVVGRTWRVYYTWNWNLERTSQCVDITFRLATSEVCFLSRIVGTYFIYKTKVLQNKNFC